MYRNTYQISQYVSFVEKVYCYTPSLMSCSIPNCYHMCTNSVKNRITFLKILIKWSPKEENGSSTLLFFKKWASYRLHRKRPPRIVNRTSPNNRDFGFNTGDCLIEVTTWAGLTVLYQITTFTFSIIFGCSLILHKGTMLLNFSEMFLRTSGNYKYLIN
jgi:hypothetical protein